VLTKSFAQWLAASAAGVTEFEYMAFGDDTHGDIVAEFVDEVQALQTASVTVRFPLFPPSTFRSTLSSNLQKSLPNLCSDCACWQVASLFSSLMSVNPSHVSGFQKPNGSNTHSVLYERVIEALSAQPQAQQQHQQQHQRQHQQQHQQQHSGLSQVSSNPSSPVASLSGFAKRLFDFDDGAGKQADEVSAAPAGAVAASDVVAADGSLFGTTLLRAHRVRGSNTLLCAVQGSVVFATTDAIVNAANQGCLGGGGVDGAVADAGGPQLDAARRALPLLEVPGGRGCIRCHTGDAVTTIGGDLHARLCIHAVGPNFSFHRDDGDALLSSAYAAAMREGRQHNVTSVAFSLLSASIFRAQKPLKHVLRLGAAAVAQSVYEGCTHVLLCGYTQEECDELEAVLGELLAEGVLE
jgi:O-acetyl-ADP-ribose deacetylase (regulator of RNase III)